jgi:vitamin K-dependent gamma-carboxylase
MANQHWKIRLTHYLYQPMDIAGLAVVRMLFGAIIMWESFRYLDLARLVAKFPAAEMTFKFVYFEWVKDLSPAGMQWVFLVYGIAGLLIFVGYFYRLAAITAFFCISYIFLSDATNYLNHFYLIIIFSGMMVFIPAHQGWSLQAWLHPRTAKSSISAWAILSLRWQLAIVYFYAAVAKMNVDWINGMPLHDWIGDRAQNGGFDVIFGYPAVIYGIAYFGLLYDMAIAPMLLIKRTRFIAYLASLFFHLSNYYLFNIGVFPWFMLATTTIFFDSSWPRELLHWASRGQYFAPVTLEPEKASTTHLHWWKEFGFAMLAVHLVFQVVFPLRHFLYASYSGWSEEGHNFSWHMKLRGKSGTIRFTLKDPDTGKVEAIPNRRYLTSRQISKMISRPDQILQYAHFLRDRYTAPGETPVEVYAETRVSLNGREAQRFVDPEVNLAKLEQTLGHRTWIFPLRQPVWNAKDKKNRFGPALKKDAWALRAIPGLDDNSTTQMAAKDAPLRALAAEK